MVTKKNIKINKNWDSITKRIYDDIKVSKRRRKRKISMEDFEIPYLKTMKIYLH